jgi:hypothetical protein
MAETFQSNAIVGGHNGTPVNIETIADSVGRKFKPVDDLGKWRPGSYKVGGNGVVKAQGYASTSWVSGFITLEQWLYLYTTTLSSAISGPVTITTRQYTPTTYVTCNAILTLDPPPDLSKGVAEYSPFVWHYTVVEIIP